ncbi:Uncharacterized protein FWK35_00033819 [Aphis craccivora]|uniref:Uncharacterized protein n=1 Tax=Aphis craccivora TaxID=307492 RepID=A0A6G0VIG0_APHCR|nr:Uncharacterized protein FWK35_00033819 [Aphis craccivora]
MLLSTLLEARTKLKIAENTSDLSTADECYTVKRTRNISKIPDPPIYSTEHIKNDDNNVFHKVNTNVSTISSEKSILPKHNHSRVKRRLYDLSSSDEADDELPKYDSYIPAPIRSKIQCTNTNNITDSAYSEKPVGSNLQSSPYVIASGQVKEMHNKTEDCLLSFRESEGINYYLLLLIHFLCKFVNA